MEQAKDNFVAAVATLHADLKASKAAGKEDLVWDKDDDAAMQFVTAVTNLRARIFGIVEKSPFDCKSIAGNIIPVGCPCGFFNV
jgi:ubiquitin-like 1-activating enzyme E1 B